jgi:hypothetical protein
MNNDSESMTRHDRGTQKAPQNDRGSALHDYLSGGAVRFADALEALSTIEYGSIAGRGPCRMFRSVICRPNLDDRGVIAMECLQQLERVIPRPVRPSGAHCRATDHRRTTRTASGPGAQPRVGSARPLRGRDAIPNLCKSWNLRWTLNRTYRRVFIPLGKR